MHLCQVPNGCAWNILKVKVMRQSLPNNGAPIISPADTEAISVRGDLTAMGLLLSIPTFPSDHQGRLILDHHVEKNLLHSGSQQSAEDY